MSKEFFSFDTVKDFDAHIARQILEYPELDALIKDIAINFLEDGTNVYDLGCSTGRMIKELSSLYQEKKVTFLGIETNPNFIKDHISTDRVVFSNKDLRTPTSFVNASMVLSIFTLQFIGEQHRERVLREAYEGLNRGGAFLLSEKVYSSTARVHKILEMRNWDLKKKQYQASEILADEKDLRDVMKPFTVEQNIADLQKAGFSEIEVVWRFNNFVAFLCIK